MIYSHFGDIRQIIINELKLANHDIYVVVAWITDPHLYRILLEKVKNGVEVAIILVDDEINLKNGFDYDEFVKLGGTVFWDNHHHKFCVIDRKTLITGSYNWTYSANNRDRRENILVIKNELELIEHYSLEFQFLKKKAKKHQLNQKEIIKIVEKQIIVQEIIQIPGFGQNIKKASSFNNPQKRMLWWKSLNSFWKYNFTHAGYVRDKTRPSKKELKSLLDTDKLNLNILEEVDDYSGLQNLSNLKIITGIKFSTSAKTIINAILPECKILV